ncbi:MAG: hypothetical protein ACK5PT_01360, partial [Cereibacter sp.]
QVTEGAGQTSDLLRKWKNPGQRLIRFRRIQGKRSGLARTLLEIGAHSAFLQEIALLDRNFRVG